MWRKLAVLGAASLLALGAASCGDDEDEAATANGGDTAAQQGSGGDAAKGGAGRGSGGAKRAEGAGKGGSGGGSAAREHEDSGGGAEQFRTPGGDNSVQEFGVEAGSEEFEAVADALHGYLDARAAGEWKVACRYMSADLFRSLQQLGTGRAESASCPQLIEAASQGIPKRIRQQAANADVGSVRITGDQAFALYHGFGGDDYIMPLKREGGAWKIVGITGSAIP